ncbi:hypothetical protein ACVWYI_001694 [Bradyrhizobium sp. LB13.1]
MTVSVALVPGTKDVAMIVSIAAITLARSAGST